MAEAQSTRLLLQRWHDDDLERLVALFSDPRVARYLSVEGRPWPRERTAGVLEHFRASGRSPASGRGRRSTSAPAVGLGRSG